MHSGDDLELRVDAIMTRYAVQNGLVVWTNAVTKKFARQLDKLIETRGLPRPLATHERGEPGEMTAVEVEPLVLTVLEGIECADEWRTAVRQLVKACFHPEFRTCRESYREVDSHGSCRRQDMNRAKSRVSGSHCIDCPYWTALTPTQHADCLAAGWAGDRREFEAHRNLFLPEDFRAFRLLVRERARRAWSPSK